MPREMVAHEACVTGSLGTDGFKEILYLYCCWVFISTSDIAPLFVKSI